MATQIQKKLTAAFGIPAHKVLTALNAAPSGRLYAGRLVGIAVGTKTGVSQYGDWTCLVGTFQHTSPDGVVQRAAQAFGPDLVIAPVAAQLANGAQSVSVAVDVFAVPSEKSPTGWNYVAEMAIEETESDPLQMLLAKTTKAPPAAAPASKASKKV